MSDPAAEARAARTAPAVFVLGEQASAFARGVVAVSGRDAPRWLDGMITNDVTALASDAPHNGCYAALLTTKGRIVADLHVLARPDGYWLETAASAVSEVLARLGKYIVADDVELADRSADFARLALEGPGAGDLLAKAAAPGARLEAVPADGWTEVRLAGRDVVLAHFGWSGEEGWQLFVPTDGGDAVCEALIAAGAKRLSLEALEILRVEAGVPRLGPELGEEVFPDEARLDRAISRTKGCYTGQEIVARLYSRGAVNHLLVGLRFEGDVAPAPDASLCFRAPDAEAGADKRTGEVTSACLSPGRGAIGLGFVRREHAEPGTRLVVSDGAGEGLATVVALPHVRSAHTP